MPSTALIIIDMQNDFLHEKGAFPRRHVDAHQLADSVRLLDQAAAQQGWEVRWIQSCYGELAAPVAGQTHTGAPCCERGSWGMELFEPLQAHVRNIQPKAWYSAFKETSLHEALQAGGVRRLILCGVATNVCVTLTAREALSLGYSVEVVEDATAAGTLSRHASALKALEAAGAKIVSCGDLFREGRLRLTGFGEGTVLHCGYLDDSLGNDDFEELQQEIGWKTMFHRGGEVPRRVALQGSVGPSGEEPLYRHPADEQPTLVPWTPGVDRLRRATEALVGHPLNHGLLQLYRDGRDWIGSHSDKTLDLIRPSHIINVSLGATRTMVLRPKGEGRAQRIPLPHGSVLVMDLETNRKWLHEIRQQGAAGEIGPRISLTFRQIGSFWNPGTKAVWGTGTPARHPADHLAPTSAEALEESERLLRLFREENQDPLFDAASYLPGFRILDFQAWREAECEPSSM